MSNKTLVTIIVIVLVLAGGTAAALYYHNNKPQDTASQDQPSSATPGGSVPLGQQDQQNNQPTQPATTTPQATTTAQTMDNCTRDFDPNKLKTAQVNIKNRQVEIDVKDFGKVIVQLYDQDAPKAVENFLRLVNSGYYDCLTFHRIAQGFVIQGGDPTGTGSGGDSAFGGPFADELNPDTPSYKAGYQHGVLAMANAGPNTNTSQFFIMLADNDLPHNYTIFGKVVSGLNVVDKIGQVPITPELGPTDGKPVTPVVMDKVTIIK